ncbi:MAG TPA: hypothetical protein VNG13_03340 [Mycobacteriales bacterium]|nr:hypothetical protein [Mycobacteriales bacterium]
MRSALLAESPRTAGPEGRITRLRDALGHRIRAATVHPRFTHGLVVVFLVQIAGILTELALVLFQPHAGRSAGSTVTDWGAGLCTGLSAAYTTFGAVRLLRGNRAGALRVLFRSVLVTVLLTQIFVFASYQTSGLIGLVFELLILDALRTAAEADHEVFQVPAQPGQSSQGP